MVQTLGSLWNLRDEVVAKIDHRRSLEDVLGRFFSLKTTDPRDKIFALLGLASGKCLNDITVDYDIPVPDLYLNVMSAICKDFTNYVLFSFAGLAADRPAFNGRPDIPSWVPDFSQPLPHTTWSARISGFNACPVSKDGAVSSHCLTIRHRTAAFPYSYGVLLEGVRFDAVVGFIKGGVGWDLSKLAKFIRKTAAILDLLRPDPTKAAATSVLRSLLVASNSDCLQQDANGEGFESFYNHVRDRNGSFDLEHAWNLKGRYLQTMMKEGVGSSRGVFWTRNGYIGLAANECQVGDDVWLVLGARVPYILRGPVLTQMIEGQPFPFCQLVCEAYLEGAMHGGQWKEGQNAVRLGLI
ncbi:hypothetical protein HJFPF1_08538 [Paramyrothecium foliicola]|nr:hypothetical protein HJFPF1_08538 [Paramyrothecium foliicola]